MALSDGEKHCRMADAGSVLGHADRRAFLASLGGAAVAALVGEVHGAELSTTDASARQMRALPSTTLTRQRRKEAYAVRVRSAQEQMRFAWPEQSANGDEQRLGAQVACFAKGLPHNELGEVEAQAYRVLEQACQSGKTTLFEAVPMAGNLRLADPQGAFTYTLEALDSQQMANVAAPTFDSAEEAAEMVEVYWHALTRDVPFAEFEGHPLIAQAAVELTRLAAFRGPRAGGAVTAQTIFRGGVPGDLTGPLVSQFLFRDVPYGATSVVQKYMVPVAADDFGMEYAEWLHIQRGGVSAASNRLDPVPRYLRNQRDLGEFVHRDFTFNAFLNAALILFGMNAPLDSGNPYLNSSSQSGFLCFGAPHLLDLTARATACALKAGWFQKWGVHRRLRPEVFAGRICNLVNGRAGYPIHPDVLASNALAESYARHACYLLPLAYPEGSPTHPAYPAGHAVIAGACATVLKAFFDESWVLPEPVVASADGLALSRYSGPVLSVEGELNKLASNLSIGRDMAGVHWRSDGMEGMRLGEEAALGLLADLKDTYTEEFAGFTLRRFDGSVVRV